MRRPSTMLVALTLIATSSAVATATEAVVDIDETLPRPGELVVSTGWLPVMIEAIEANELTVRAIMTANRTDIGERVLITNVDNIITVRQEVERQTLRPRAALAGREGFISVGLPRGVSVSVDTASGEVSLAGEIVGSVAISTASGAITIDEGMRASRLRLNTASGDAVIHGWAQEVIFNSASGGLAGQWASAVGSLKADSTCGEITAPQGAHTSQVSTTSGDITLGGLRGSATVDSLSGDVTLQWETVTPQTSVNVSTLSGNQCVTFPKAVTPGGAVETFSGEVTSDLPIYLSSSNPGVFRVTGDDGQIDLKSASGAIQIQHAP